MDKNALEAPCGLHCGQCVLNKAVADEKLRGQIADKMNISPEKATCPGCRAIDGYCPVINEQCATWVCSKGKNIEFCHECIDFPCVKLMPCADRASGIPHNIKVFSLSLRKNKGAFEWEKAIPNIYKLYYQGEMVIGSGPKPKSPPTSTP